MIRAVVCDLDGTLCLFGNRPPYDRDYENDEINKPIGDILDNILYCNYEEVGEYTEVIFVTGRMEKHRKMTELWLNHHGYGDLQLFMRKDGDTRKDVIIKSEIYEAEIKNKYEVFYVLDDRNQVVQFWRSIGLTCFQVADGDF